MSNEITRRAKPRQKQLERDEGEVGEHRERFPSQFEVRTGETLPLAGNATRDGDERSTIPLPIRPAVMQQRIVFVAMPSKASITRERELLTPSTLRGPGGADPVAAEMDLPLDAHWLVSPAPEPSPRAKALAEVSGALPLPAAAEQLEENFVVADPVPNQAAALVVARVNRPAREAASRNAKLVLVAIALVGVCAAAWSYPLQLDTVAMGTFERYAQTELALSPARGEVRAVHVHTGQEIETGNPVLTFDDSALAQELSELTTSLDTTQQALEQAKVANRAQAAEAATSRAQALKGITQRVTEQRAEIAGLERKRDELINAQPQRYVSPLSLAAIDDRIDLKHDQLRALESEQARIKELTPAAPTARETELATDLQRLGDRRAAVEREREATVVRAEEPGLVVESRLDVGSSVEPHAPLFAFIPAGTTLAFVASFDQSYANDIDRARTLTLQPTAAAPVRVRVRRVQQQPEGKSCQAELTLLDDTRAPDVAAALAQSGSVRAEFLRETSLFWLSMAKASAAFSFMR